MKYIFAGILTVILGVFILIIGFSDPNQPLAKENSTKLGPVTSPQTRELIESAKMVRDASIDINDPETCKRCHADIYEEWDNSYHRFAHEDPLFRTFALFNQKNEPGIPMCENCHISEATLEVAPLTQPVSRRDSGKKLRLEHGIDCASCHRRYNQIVGRYSSGVGCFTTGDKFFATAKYCGGCHITFLPYTKHEYDEWVENPAPVSVKKTCVECHMPEVPGGITGGKGSHKQHYFYGGHNLAMLKKAVKFEVSFLKEEKQNYVVVKVINLGTGHHFPTGTAKRRVNIVVSVEDGEGLYIGGGDLDMRKPSKWTAGAGTQVTDKGSRKFYFMFDESETPGKAHVKVIYKLYPSASEEESSIIYDAYHPMPAKK